MACNGFCAKCCCCGPKQLRELPGYNEDINDPGRPDKATIRWNFDGGLFDGEHFDLVRVNYTDPLNIGSYASPEWICMVEYRPEPGYGYGGGGGGPVAVCVGPTKNTPWVRVAYGKCCPLPVVGPNRAHATFYRLSVSLCDIALSVARCRKTKYECDYVNTEDEKDTCGYLVNARMKLKLIVQVAEYARGGLFDVFDCYEVEYPTAEDVPASSSGFWAISDVSETLLPVARSRVVSSLIAVKPTIEIFLPYGINQKDCCSEWGIPENAFGDPKPEGWNDEYFQCQAEDGDLDIEIEAPECLYDNDSGCLNPPCCPNGFECVRTDYEQNIKLGDWSFIGTGDPA